MSQELINHSRDLKMLRDEGYELEVRGTKLLVSGVPYLDKNGKVRYGILVSILELAGDRTTKPEDHKAFFIGDQPCRKDGSEIGTINLSVGDQPLGDGITVNRAFSNKPPNGYTDHHEKITRYIEIISAPVRSLYPKITAKTFKVIKSNAAESVMRYLDTNSSRAEIDIITDKLKGEKVAIIGVGGTGAYVLDFVAKTPVSEIHIWDGDEFLQHNAFRAPGAPSLPELRRKPSKVRYLHSIYSKMRRKIIVHDGYINKDRLPSFEGFRCRFFGCGRRAFPRGLALCEGATGRLLSHNKKARNRLRSDGLLSDRRGHRRILGRQFDFACRCGPVENKSYDRIPARALRRLSN